EVKGELTTLKVNLDGVWLGGKKVLESDSAWYECRRNQFTEFVHWARGRRTAYAAGASSSARTAELALAMYESGRCRSPVDLPLANKGDVIGELFGHAVAADERPAPAPRAIARNAQ